MASAPGGRSDLAKIVERQMRNWELARAQRLEVQPEAEDADVMDFVAISRSVGSGGGAVAAALGEKLNWPVFDREILQAMAGDDQIRARLYEQMDERDTTWLESSLRWLIQGEFRKEDYYHRLSETMLALARRGPAVFLGRAADLILPASRGLRVRITASEERRGEELAGRLNVTPALARAEVERIDRERAEFRRNRYGKSANAMERFDLMVNMDAFTVDQAVELIHSALRMRGLKT